MSKPRILALTVSYLPGFKGGGPVRSIANLVDRLGDDFDWRIVTSDRDFKAPAPYDDVVADAWTGVGKARVYYAGSATRAPAALVELIRRTPHDLLYLNSFFDFRFSVLPVLAGRLGRLRRPVLIAPRGEFSEGAMALKPWKKRPFIGMARLSGAWRNVAWHASTQHEADDILRVMGGAPGGIHLARNLSASFTGDAKPDATSLPDGGVRVCFLSRIVRKKNLDFALRALARVRGSVHFRIYGPKEDPEYWKECEGLIASLPPNIRVTYEGAVPAERVVEALSGNDLFFFPTRGENFGHVFVEAWSAGLAVLTSDQTPWRGLEKEGLGWDFQLDDLEAFARIVDSASRWDSGQREGYRARAADFARRQSRDEAAVEANRRMFRNVIGKGEGR